MTDIAPGYPANPNTRPMRDDAAPRAEQDVRRLVQRVLLTGVHDSYDGVLMADGQEPYVIKAAQVVALCRALRRADPGIAIIADEDEPTDAQAEVERNVEDAEPLAVCGEDIDHDWVFKPGERYARCLRCDAVDGPVRQVLRSAPVEERGKPTEGGEEAQSQPVAPARPRRRGEGGSKSLGR